MERWRDVVGYEGLYEVSDLGRVRSVDRVVKGRRYKGRVLRLNTSNPDGYVRIVLVDGGRRRDELVHRIMLEAWVGPCPDGCEACHDDGIRSNNKLSNVRWDTHVNNEKDKYAAGNGLCKRVVRSDGIEFDSMKEAAESVGLSHGGDIGRVCRGMRRTTGGFGWSYVD
jgi:hypothetical protein